MAQTVPPLKAALILAGAPTIGPGGQLDIEVGGMIVNYSTGDNNVTRNAIRNLLINGRNASPDAPAPWNGLGGITSSYANPANAIGNGTNLAIGYADNAALASINPSGSYASFGGQTVASTAILVRMTIGADANLDGVVDSNDIAMTGAHFNQPGSGQWYLGDFGYSGMCDAHDVNVLGATFDKSSPTPSPAQLSAQYGSAFADAFAAGLNGTVPEPGGIVLIGLGAIGLATRRRRSR